MRRVIVETPYAGDVELNLRYLRACLADSLARGEAPFASHGLYTQPGVLDDSDSAQRAQGIAAGFSWRHAASATVVYTDLGISNGMRLGINAALELAGTPFTQHAYVEYRSLGADRMADVRRQCEPGNEPDEPCEFATQHWGAP